MVRRNGRAVGQLGEWLCGPPGEKGNELVGLAKLVCHVKARDGDLWQRALALVFDQLQRNLRVEVFHRATGDAYARRIEIDRVLVPGRPALAERMGVLPRKTGQSHTLVRLPAESARASIVGSSGALSMAREAWSSARALSLMPDALNEGIGSMLGIRLALARELFGYDLPPHLLLVEHGSSVRPDGLNMKRPNKAADKWTAAVRDELLKQHRVFTDRGLGIEKADDALANAWNCSSSTIKQQRLKRQRELFKETSPGGQLGQQHRITR